MNFHTRHKFPASKSENNPVQSRRFIKRIFRGNIECAFPNVEIALRIFRTLIIVTNCSIERSFSHLERTKNPNRSTMKQERFISLPLLMIQADIFTLTIYSKTLLDINLEKTTLKCK